jgi:hypothetical protein
MTDDASVQATPSTPRRDLSDLEDTIYRAFHMSSVAVTLAEKALKHTAESLGGLPNTYFVHPQDVDTLLFSLYEVRAQIREAYDLFTGVSDDNAPAKAVAEAQ